MKKLILASLTIFAASCSQPQSEVLLINDSTCVDSVKCVHTSSVCLDSMSVTTVTDSIVK